MKDQGTQLTRGVTNAFWSSMRRLAGTGWALFLAATLAACAKSSGSAGAFAEAGAGSASASAPLPELSTLRNRFREGPGRPPGGECDPAKQAAVCSPDGTTQLSCNMGKWQTVHLCDGPNGCKGSGNDLVCDMKPVKEGDACTGGLNMPRCNDGQTLMQCMNGKWKKLVCSLPGHCRPPADDMPAGCRL